METFNNFISAITQVTYPATGDHNNIRLYLLILVLSLCVIVTMIYFKKKNEYDNNKN